MFQKENQMEHMDEPILTCPSKADRRELFPLPTPPQTPTREPLKETLHDAG